MVGREGGGRPKEVAKRYGGPKLKHASHEMIAKKVHTPQKQCHKVFRDLGGYDNASHARLCMLSLFFEPAAMVWWHCGASVLVYWAQAVALCGWQGTRGQQTHTTAKNQTKFATRVSLKSTCVIVVYIWCLWRLKWRAFGQEIGVLFGHHTRAAQNTNGAQQHTTQFMINSTHDFVTIVPRTGTTASVAGV